MKQPAFEQTMVCEGWWEQRGVGRQPMEELVLGFAGRAITGQGRDIVGAFRFRGKVGENGTVLMRKQYIGQHHVDYLGHYDGEGVMRGEWRINMSPGFAFNGFDDSAGALYIRGAWLIRIKSLVGEDSSAIQDLAPIRRS